MGDNHHGLDLAEELPVVAKCLGVALGGHAVALRLDRIGDADQFDRLHGGQFLGVKSAQPARPDHAHAYLVHAALLRSRPRP